ncbi:MAG: polysaccharide biosynthesis/export family protein [Candidatus Coatesbacteria bacterium]
MRQRLVPVCAVLLGIGLAACGGGKSAVKAPATDLPTDLAKAVAAEYRISPQDLLDISVYGEADLTRPARVTADGRINFPLIGEVEIAGLTLAQAEAALRAKLNAFVVNPFVSVSVKESHARRVVILGEVTRPGAIDIPTTSPLTCVEAIAQAGGFTKYAAGNSVRVVRKTAAGGQETITVPVNDVTKGDKDKDLVLQPEDVIFVPQTLF